ncbi:hypothetical protein T08_6343, partial [Trichinella sp. T8]
LICLAQLAASSFMPSSILLPASQFISRLLQY